LLCSLAAEAFHAFQAFYLARTGRPGPVLIDVPKDVQQQLAVPDWDVPMAISGYMARLPQQPTPLVSLFFRTSPRAGHGRDLRLAAATWLLEGSAVTPKQ
jgi:hypothetical protein